MNDVWCGEIVTSSTLAAPTLGSVEENEEEGTITISWDNSAAVPLQYLGFAWDIYTENFVQYGMNDTMWYHFHSTATTGTLDLGGGEALSGAYFVWISNQYNDGGWYPCENPATVILTGGLPHRPVGVEATLVDDLGVRLEWKTEPFGTWLYWIVAYRVDSGEFVEIEGARGEGLWHYVTIEEEDFLDGSAEFAVPSSGAYWFFIAAVAWDDPAATSDFTPAFVAVP